MWRILKKILINLFWGLLDFVLFFWILNNILIPYKPNDFVTTTSKPIIYRQEPNNTTKLVKPKANKDPKNNSNKLPKATKIEKQALNTAKHFWINELGFDPFWNIPIYWNTPLKSSNQQLQPLGVTKTLVGHFPLTENKKVAYMQIDDSATQKQNIDLAKVLAHEWGHALGLKHGYGIMEPLASDMTWKVNNKQKQLIKQNYQAGH